uniref:Sugar phosphate transporter domain-containing protein n=1 Tax=Oryza meridionalis TaxID=40149 RepID=A0A0E0CFS9_9ORYZ
MGGLRFSMMSNLSEPSKEAASADDSSAVQKTGAWSNTLNILLQQASVYGVAADNQFTVTAYTWAVAYLASMSIDFVYIKHVVMTIGLNTWGLMKGDNAKVTNWLSSDVILPVALSCLFGLSISFFGFSCRRAISATGFTVLGIVNKLLTVVINLLIWDKHASFVGTIGLLICMSGGVLYQQSTTKPKAPKAEPKEENDEDQQQKTCPAGQAAGYSTSGPLVVGKVNVGKLSCELVGAEVDDY